MSQFTKLSKTAASLALLLGIKKIPTKEGKVDFSEEQHAKLTETFGEDTVAKILSGFNSELEAMETETQNLEQIKAEILEEIKASTELTAEQKTEIIEGKETGDIDITAEFKRLNQLQKDIKAQLEALKTENKKLLGEDEPDAGERVTHTMKNNALIHSATHLFASTEQYNAFKDRPWNERLRDNGLQATDFGLANLPVLQGDLDHFIRQNPGVIESLFDDFRTLPKEWSRTTGVADQIATANIVPESDLMQGRSKGWNPKGNVKIAAEQSKVFAKKIDITFNGQQLQEFERTWIASIQNLDGSHPWKMSFIFFILTQLLLALRYDERNAMINGIFVQTPDGDQYTGSAVNSQNGLLWNWWYYREIRKQYAAFAMGNPTEAGIVDYIRTMIEKIPEKERGESGWEIQLTEAWMKIYQKKAGEIYGLRMNTDEGKQDYSLNHPIDYPNFKFQPLVDMTKTNFIGIIKSSNNDEMQFRPEEKEGLTMTHEKRDTHFFGDYKSGFRFKLVGTKVNPEQPNYFDKQVLYSNDVPIFHNSVSIPAWDIDDETGVLKMNYLKVKVDKTWHTDITNIEGLEDNPYRVDLKGQVIHIVGNTLLTASKYVKDNANLDLTADFDLKSGGTLTLFGMADGKFKELSRTTEPEAPVSNSVPFNTSAIDANNGTQFNFNGTIAVTLNSIINGVDGKVITITKTDADTEGALTISETETIKPSSTAVLDALNDKISFVLANGVWYETARTIAS